MEGVELDTVVDARLSWLSAKVVFSLKIKPEVLQRFLLSENR